MAAFDITALGSPASLGNLGSSIVFRGNVKQLSETRVVVAYNINNSASALQVCDVNKSTGEITPLSTPLNFYGSGAFYKIEVYDDTHFIVWWAGAGNDGFVRSFQVNAGTGAVTTWGSELEYDTVSGEHVTTLKMDSNHFLAAWTGSGDDGFAQIFTLNTGTGAITKEGTAFEFDTTQTRNPSLQHISGGNVLCVYAGESDNGYAVVLNVNTSTWAVTAAGSTTEWNGGITVQGMDSSLMTSDTVRALTAYSDFLEGIFIESLNVNTSTWAVTNGTVDGDKISDFGTTTNGAVKFIHRLDDTHFLIFFPGLDGTEADGYVRTYEVDWGTGAITQLDEVEFDTTNATENTSVDMGDGFFVNAWKNGTSGLVQAFQVELPSTFTASPLIHQMAQAGELM